METEKREEREEDLEEARRGEETGGTKDLECFCQGACAAAVCAWGAWGSSDGGSALEKFISRMCRCKCRTHSSWMERGPWNSTSQNLRGATERSSQRCEKRQRHSFACSPGHPLLSLSTPTLEGSHMCVSTHTPSRYSGRWWVLPEGHVTCHDTSTPMEGCELADPAHGSRVGLRS